MRTIVFLSHFDGNLYLFRLPIMQALAERGWRVIALVPSGAYSPKFAEHGIEHIPYKINRAGLNPFGAIAAIRAIARTLKRIKPEILHCFTVKPNLYGAIAGKIAGVPRIYATVTGLGSYFIDTSYKAVFVRRVILCGYRLAGVLAHKVLFQNRDDLAFFVDRGIVRREKAAIIGSSGIDTDRWKREGARGEGECVVLSVMRLIAHKGIHELIAAARAIRAKHGDNIRFVIVGGRDEGNPSSVSEAQIEAWQSEQIAGFALEQMNVKPFYETADIFVLPSYREGVPRTILEAEAMSLPIVTTDTVGCRDAIEAGVTGFLVPARDATLLEAAIERLAVDIALRRQMGENARALAVERFGINAVIARYLELYE
ncbi:glycosyl transferase [Campylobacterota bacterium]|nr:glycosyl transferase [Campylobacterota bacterium]